MGEVAISDQVNHVTHSRPASYFISLFAEVHTQVCSENSLLHACVPSFVTQGHWALIHDSRVNRRDTVVPISLHQFPLFSCHPMRTPYVSHPMCHFKSVAINFSISSGRGGLRSSTVTCPDLHPTNSTVACPRAVDQTYWWKH